MENGGNLPSEPNTTSSETTTNGSTGSTTTGSDASSPGGSSPGSKSSQSKRKKRSNNEVTETSTKDENSKNGCPKDFERISDYLCLHLHKDAEGDGVQNSFEGSKKYCQEKDSSASVLQFVNDKEASKIWNWLG